MRPTRNMLSEDIRMKSVEFQNRHIGATADLADVMASGVCGGVHRRLRFAGSIATPA